jgi:hypothetical protein
MSIAAYIESVVTSWDGVTAQDHRFGGREYRVAHHEIGHLHGSRLADLPFPRRVGRELIAEGKALPHHYLPQTGWVSYPIRGDADVEGAIALFRQNYERIVARASAVPVHD